MKSAYNIDIWYLNCDFENVDLGEWKTLLISNPSNFLCKDESAVNEIPMPTISPEIMKTTVKYMQNKEKYTDVK